MTSKPIALITGASRGIGAETAVLFARRGYAVCINYFNNDAAAHSVAATIRTLGGTCIVVKADVSKESEILRLYAIIDAQMGPLSVLVNNAAILQQQCRLETISAERLLQVLQLNVVGPFLCCREAVKRMSTRHGGSGGAIVNVSSMASKTGSPNEYVDYAASKGAMDSMTIGLAKEVAVEGIRVNGVRPGLIYTDMHAAGGEPGRVDRLKSKIPMQRGGHPREVAEAIFWLASERASFATGSFIDLAGGL